jgi:ribosomal protein S18 acetylase RimI-like enzyme
MPEITIERVAQDPGPVIAGLVEESSAQGFGALRRLVSDWTAGTCRFSGPGEGLFIALADGRVAGVCAVDTAPGSTENRVGRLRDMYVSVTQRRAGVGRAMVQRVITEAAGYFTRLELRADTQGAKSFYESLGFRPTPDTTNSTHELDLDAARVDAPA